MRARLGIAAHLDALHQTDLAIEQLEALVKLRPRAPHGSLAMAYLRLRQARDRMGDRAVALDAYRLARAHAAPGDPADVTARAERGIRHAPDARAAEAYRLSIQGWRRLEEQDLSSAVGLLEPSIAPAPRDPVTHYRLGRLLFARRDDGAAVAAFEAALAGARSCPAPILAATYLEAARSYERAGRRADALAAYRTSATLFGGAQETRAAAQRAIARLEKTRH